MILCTHRMHLVTSSIFLPSLAAHLTPRSQVLLLKSHLLISVVWYIAVSRPPIDIESFMASTTTAHPFPPSSVPPQSQPQWALPNPSSPLATTPNPWLAVIQRTLAHPEDHLAKLQRAFAHYAQMWGDKPAGYLCQNQGGTVIELKGAEKLDGTLFIRAAGLTIDRLGKDTEGDMPRFWDRDV
jgi:hypothetical protein